MQTRQVSLVTFMRGSSDPKDRMPGCANYDHGRKGCLLADKCGVEAGVRCRYFERSVLPTASDIGQLQEITFAYERAVGHIVIRNKATKAARMCPDCKVVVLLPHERLCEKCKAAHRRTSYRARRQNVPRATDVAKTPIVST